MVDKCKVCGTAHPEKNCHRDFRRKLEVLINSHSMENGSDTPDFILAQYLADCLASFDLAVKLRTKWYAPEQTTGGSGEVPVAPVSGMDSALSGDEHLAEMQAIGEIIDRQEAMAKSKLKEGA